MDEMDCPLVADVEPSQPTVVVEESMPSRPAWMDSDTERDCELMKETSEVKVLSNVQGPPPKSGPESQGTGPAICTVGKYVVRSCVEFSNLQLDRSTALSSLRFRLEGLRNGTIEVVMSLEPVSRRRFGEGGAAGNTGSDTLSVPHGTWQLSPQQYLTLSQQRYRNNQTSVYNLRNCKIVRIKADTRTS